MSKMLYSFHDRAPHHFFIIFFPVTPYFILLFRGFHCSGVVPGDKCKANKTNTLLHQTHCIVAQKNKQKKKNSTYRPISRGKTLELGRPRSLTYKPRSPHKLRKQNHLLITHVFLTQGEFDWVKQRKRQVNLPFIFTAAEAVGRREGLVFRLLRHGS